MVQQSLDNIKSRVHEIASRRIIPFTMGGDHTITWPAATAVADVYGYGNVGMVHFDAHADTADTIDGNLASHGTPMRRLIESGAIPGRNFIQIGLRSYWPPQDVWEWMAEQGMRWHLMDEIWERGFQAVMADAVQRGARRARAPLHLDRHRLARSGLRTRHRHARARRPRRRRPAAHGSLARLRHHIVGMDVVEVAPAYDHADCTVNVANRLFMECLAGLAAKRRDLAGGTPGLPAG